MNTLLYLLPVCAMLYTAPKATPEPHTIYLNKSFFRFGDQLITLEKYKQGGETSYVLVSLHSNEAPAIRAAMEFAHTHSAVFLRLLNQEQRMVEADFFDQKVRFDPNQVFTTWGRRIELRENDCFNKLTNLRVQQFARFILGEIRPGKTIVSVHNTETANSINVYNGAFEKEAKEVYINPEKDAADYFITGEENYFNSLKAQGYNVVLLHRSRMKDDGSLAVYCSKSNQPYVIVNALGSHTEEQVRMIEAVDRMLK